MHLLKRHSVIMGPKAKQITKELLMEQMPVCVRLIQNL